MGLAVYVQYYIEQAHTFLCFNNLIIGAKGLLNILNSCYYHIQKIVLYLCTFAGNVCSSLKLLNKRYGKQIKNRLNNVYTTFIPPAPRHHMAHLLRRTLLANCT